MNIPDFMPRLRKGAGRTPQDGGCLVQVASYLNDGVSWTDRTPCVHPMLRHVAIGVNDSVGEDARQGLLKFAPRLIGTGTKDRIIERQMVAWCMRYRPEFATWQREATYRRYTDEGLYGTWYSAPAGYVKQEDDVHDPAAQVAGFVLREIYQGSTRKESKEIVKGGMGLFAPWELATISENADQMVVQYLEDMIDFFDKITGREVSGKTVTDEDWAKVRDHMAHA